MKRMNTIRISTARLAMTLALALLTVTAWATTTTVTYTLDRRTNSNGSATIYSLVGTDGTSQDIYDGGQSAPFEINVQMGSDVSFQVYAGGNRITCGYSNDISDLVGFTNYFSSGSSTTYTFTFTSQSRYITHIQIDGFGYSGGKKAKTTISADNKEKTCTIDWVCGSGTNRNGAPGKFIVTYSDTKPTTTYNISYVLNGGTNSSTNPSTYDDDKGVTSFANPTRTGYEFGGWYDNASLTGTAITSIAAGSTGDKTLYAKWAPKEYNITYNLGNGAVVTGNPSTYTIESTAFTLATPTRTGYVFDGWTGTGLNSATNTVTIPQGSTGDRTYTATWHVSPLLGYTSSYTPDGTTNPYIISSIDGWNLLCDCLQNNDAWNRFSGKTVKMGADIGNSSNPVTRQAGSAYHDFCGTFDGDGHTLTISLGTAESPIDAQYVAPFPNTADNGESKPTFRNLTIDGHIYEAYTGSEEHHHVGGLIGHLYGTVTIEHCTSKVSITSSGGAGGFVGLCETAVSFTDCVSSAIIHSAGGNNSGFIGWSRSSNYTINFMGCIFNGKLLQVGDNGSYNGGFIGWKGDYKTVTITNSLIALATLADGETMADAGSATFSREHNNYAATINNSYYTVALGTAQGKAPLTITAGANVTVSVSPKGSATQTYNVSGITAYANGITHTVGNVTTFYYGQDDEVSLTLANTPPTGYNFNGYTASAGTLSGTGNPYTLIMPDENVEIGADFMLLPVNYLDKNGVEQTCTDYTLLTGNETTISTPGWYVARGILNYTNTLNIDADVNLILTDGCQMNIGMSSSRLNNHGIFNSSSSNNITIYGQSTDYNIGILSIYVTGQYKQGITCKDITINGGHVISNTSGNNTMAFNVNNFTMNGGIVEATSTGSYTYAIYSIKKFTYNGGILEASGQSCSIAAYNSSNQYNFSWRNTGDRITIGSSGFFIDNIYTSKVNITRLFTDPDENYYGGSITGSNINTVLAGKTLIGTSELILADNADNTARIAAANSFSGLDVTLYGRTLYKDGGWNTLCLPFNVSLEDSPLAGAMVKTLGSASFSNGTLTLNFTDATSIEAGKPYIIKWDGGNNITNPFFENVTLSTDNTPVETDIVSFVGSFSRIEFPNENRSVLLMGGNSKLFYPDGEALSWVNACRAYFLLDDGYTAGNPAVSNVKNFVLNFDGDATGIDNLEFTIDKGYYTIDGRKIDGKPTVPGIYILNGKKVLIK